MFANVGRKGQRLGPVCRALDYNTFFFLIMCHDLDESNIQKY